MDNEAASGVCGSEKIVVCCPRDSFSKSGQKVLIDCVDPMLSWDSNLLVNIRCN